MMPRSDPQEDSPQLAPAEERRRSQRVLIRIPVILHFVLQTQSVRAMAHTIAVNDHGALLICSRDFPAGTRLELQHGLTHKRVACLVTRPPREVADGFQLPIEFEKPASGFWQVFFPPPDWKPTEESSS